MGVNWVYRITQRYIPDCPGFSMHAFRHIVATEFIKNNPAGFAIAAAILHDKEETVRRHYAWAAPGRQVRRLEHLRQQTLEAARGGRRRGIQPRGGEGGMTVREAAGRLQDSHRVIRCCYLKLSVDRTRDRVGQ